MFFHAIDEFEHLVLLSDDAEEGHTVRKHFNIFLKAGKVVPWDDVGGNNSTWVQKVTMICNYRLVDVLGLLHNKTTFSVLRP